MNDIQRAIEILERNKPTSDPRLCGKELCNACDVAISAMQELQQYRQLGTVEQCDGYKTHSQHISKMCSCNDCGRSRDCEIAPQPGDDCRINCYLWKEAEKMMDRMTQKDEWGNWMLKELAWESLYVGKEITERMRELLYNALWKLMEYEDTGYTPEQIQNFDALYLKKCQEVNALRKRMQWIPVTERLPKNGTRALVTFEDGFVAATEYYDNGWDLWADSGDVIAWMPLPEPYREEA